MNYLDKLIVFFVVIVFSGGASLAEEKFLPVNKVENELINILNAGPNHDAEKYYLSALESYIKDALNEGNNLDYDIILKSAKYTYFISDEVIRSKSRKMIIGALDKSESVSEKALEARRICEGELNFTGISYEKAKRVRAEFEDKALNYIEILLHGGDGSSSLREVRKTTAKMLSIDYVEYPYRAKSLKAIYILQVVNAPEEAEIIPILNELREEKDSEADELLFKKVILSVEANIETRISAGLDNDMLNKLKLFLNIIK